MGDILTKLRFLFIVVIALFGIMHFFAFLGVVVDESAKRKTMKQLKLPEFGFEETLSGVWTWRLFQHHMQKAVDAPRGSAVELASVLAFPFARLRVALPSEMLPGTVASCVGFRDGFSAHALEESKEEIGAAMQNVSRGFKSFFGGRDKLIPAFDLPDVVPKDRRFALFDADFSSIVRDVDRLHPEAPDPARMVGTALVLAHIANQRALPLVQLGERKAAASRHFQGVRLQGIDHGFDDLVAMFMLMLGDDAGALSVGKSWMLTARAWRLIFLQRADGSFDSTSSLAFALGAHEGPMPPPVTSRIGKLMAKLKKLDEFVDDEEDGDNFDAPAEVETAGAAPRKGDVDDCPLTFHRSAFRRRMPPELARLPGADTLWATLLAMTYLEKSVFSWNLTDEEEEEEEEARTTVDAARGYIEARCREDADVRRLFKQGILQAAAERAHRRWQAARAYAVERTRSAEAVGAHRPLHVLQRAISRVSKACCTDHATFACILDADGFLARWQRIMILFVRLFSRAARAAFNPLFHSRQDSNIWRRHGVGNVFVE